MLLGSLISFLLLVPPDLVPGTKLILSKHHFEPVTYMLQILGDSQKLTELF